ncbi:hypothetical protein Tco_0979980 [Tanacetum coccineum]
MSAYPRQISFQNRIRWPMTALKREEVLDKIYLLSEENWKVPDKCESQDVGIYDDRISVHKCLAPTKRLCKAIADYMESENLWEVVNGNVIKKTVKEVGYIIAHLRFLLITILDVESHELFPAISQLIKSANMTPADVAENLYTKSDAESCLKNLIKSLKIAVRDEEGTTSGDSGARE